MAKTASKKSSAKKDDAIAMLQEDHKRVQQLFEDFEDAHEEEDDATAQEIAEIAIAELQVHAALEEEIFYPALREQIEDEELIDQAEVEHQSAKTLMGQLKDMPAEDPKFAATFKVLAEYVRHHVKEEEGEIFKQVKKAKVDTQELGGRLAARKKELAAQMGLAEEEEDTAESEADESPRSARSRQRG